jgi:hypothetical protein
MVNSKATIMEEYEKNRSRTFRQSVVLVMEIGSSPAASLFNPATAESFFGSASAESIISAGQSSSGTSDQQSAALIITAQKREINRIRGYKLELSPADLQKLSKLKVKIQEIEAKAAAGTVRADELDDRLEFLDDADRIVGKPIVDIEVDDTLAEYNALKVALLEPKLDRATAKHVAFLERVKDAVGEQINNNPDRHSLALKFQSIDGIIDRLKPLRSPADLSRAEIKTYDDIVELINNHLDVKVELTAAETAKVAALESSIAQFQSILGPDLSQQPTAQAVANAYVSLKL